MKRDRMPYKEVQPGYKQNTYTYISPKQKTIEKSENYIQIKCHNLKREMKRKSSKRNRIFLNPNKANNVNYKKNIYVFFLKPMTRWKNFLNILCRFYRKYLVLKLPLLLGSSWEIWLVNILKGSLLYNPNSKLYCNTAISHIYTQLQNRP